MLSHEHDKRIHLLKTIKQKDYGTKNQNIIQQFYRASEEEAEDLKNELISMVETYGKSSVVSALESGKKKNYYVCNGK